MSPYSPSRIDHPLTPAGAHWWPRRKPKFDAITPLRNQWEDTLQRGDLTPVLEDWVDLPQCKTNQNRFDQGYVTIGNADELSQRELQRIESKIHQLIPWRKGPFSLFGLPIDAEWRADMKWDRMVGSLPSLENQAVLDLGCGNGYHMFRMLPLRPRLVIGVDPNPFFRLQFELIQRYAHQPGLVLETWGSGQMSPFQGCFDTVFCMGVLYHRRDPLGFLKLLHELLGKRGTLVLETIVFASAEDICLCPSDRYAGMNNVFFLPSVRTLTGWLTRSGFTHSRLISQATTTFQEQRNTPLYPTPRHSLNQFLDALDPKRTVEGHPAPVRACLVAQKM